MSERSDEIRTLCLELAKTMSPSGDYIGAGPEARRRIWEAAMGEVTRRRRLPCPVHGKPHDDGWEVVQYSDGHLGLREKDRR